MDFHKELFDEGRQVCNIIRDDTIVLLLFENIYDDLTGYV